MGLVILGFALPMVGRAVHKLVGDALYQSQSPVERMTPAGGFVDVVSMFVTWMVTTESGITWFAMVAWPVICVAIAMRLLFGRTPRWLGRNPLGASHA
jgi:hypothetical protein